MSAIRHIIAMGNIAPDAEARTPRLALLPLDLLLLSRP